MGKSEKEKWGKVKKRKGKKREREKKKKGGKRKRGRGKEKKKGEVERKTEKDLSCLFEKPPALLQPPPNLCARQKHGTHASFHCICIMLNQSS